jgi:uncharacterized protein with von Willebrand factor type A (vWA) domain
VASRHDIYDTMAQWMIIHTREQKKYREAYELFYTLKREYLGNPAFTHEGADRNKAWLTDARTQDAITAMKDAWASMQAAESTVQILLVQLDPQHGVELGDAMQRLRDRATRLADTPK